MGLRRLPGTLGVGAAGIAAGLLWVAATTPPRPPLPHLGAPVDAGPAAAGSAAEAPGAAAPAAVDSPAPQPPAPAARPGAQSSCGRCPPPTVQGLTLLSVQPLNHTLPPPPALPRSFGTLVFAGDSLTLSRGVNEDGATLPVPPRALRKPDDGPRPAYPLVCMAALRAAGYSGRALFFSKPGLGLIDWAREAERLGTTIADQVVAGASDIGGVVLQLGVNDAFHGASPATLLAVMRRTALELRQRLPSSALVLATVTPSLFEHPTLGTTWWHQAVNAGIAEIAAAAAAVVADSHWALLSLWRQSGRDWEAVLRDKVHPTTEGQARIGHVVAGALLAAPRHYSVSLLCQEEVRWLGWRVRPRWKDPGDCAGNPRLTLTLLDGAAVSASLPVPCDLMPPWHHAFTQYPQYGKYRLTVRSADGRTTEEVIDAPMGGPAVWWRLPAGDLGVSIEMQRPYSKRTNYGNRLLPVQSRRRGEDPARGLSPQRELTAARVQAEQLQALQGGGSPLPRRV